MSINWIIVIVVFLDTIQGEQAAMRLAPNNNNEIGPQHRELRFLLFAKGVWDL